MLIEDGKGSGQKASVNDNGSLQTDAVTRSYGTHASQDGGGLYSWAISDNTSGAEYVLAIRNDDPIEHLCIQTLRGSSDVASIWTIAFGTWSTVGGDSAVTAYNAHSDSGRKALATAYMTATNLTLKRLLMHSYIGADKEVTYRPNGKITLGYHDVVYIHNSAASTAYLTAFIWGYYREL